MRPGTRVRGSTKSASRRGGRLVALGMAAGALWLTMHRGQLSLLGETLRDMYMSHPMDSLLVVDTLLQELTPPAPLQEVEPEEKALLDSCLYYTDALAALYGGSVLLALQDSVAYAETERRLQQAYEYAQDNYAQTQKNIFIGGSVNAVHIIRNWDGGAFPDMPFWP